MVVSNAENKKKRVLIAMSGGVDSSAAAALLVDQGYDVVGVTMQVWDYSTCDITDGGSTCCSSKDVDDARAVADLLGIPFYVVNCEDKFEEKVINPFVNSYMKGETPSPCVNCNTFLKFDHLLDKMHELECDYLATGHYAKVVEGPSGNSVIATSADGWKDQTYFLFTLKQDVIPYLLFPVGDMEKDLVRKYSEDKGLVNAKKKDSVGICFVGKQGYANFIENRIDTSKVSHGEIKHYPTGEVMGQHEGIYRYTIGQRKGLGMDHHETLFVVKIDSKEDTVWVGDEEHLFASDLKLENVNWMDDFSDEDELRVKIRFHHHGAKAKVKKDGNKAKIIFSEPQRAITFGQAAVVYRGEQLLGGGWIC